jgi:hypothetical protein
MNVRTPATSIVAALDEPWRFLRRDFGKWAPPAFGIAALGMVPSLVMQWFSGGLAAASANPDAFDFVALGGFYAGACGALVAYVVGQLAAFVIAARVLDGERPGLGEALLGGISPRLVVIGGGAMLVTLFGFACIVAGPILGGVFLFAPVIVVTRGGWASALTEGVNVATQRASPSDAGLPMWKLAAITTIWYGVYLSGNQLASLPTLVWTLWHVISNLGQGDFLTAMQFQAPFPVGAATAVVGALLRPFADIYLAAGAIILWRDIQRVRAGADLEALVSEGVRA